MTNISDVIVVLIIVVVLLFALKGAIKRVKGGCCGGGSKPKKIKPKNTNTDSYAYKTVVFIDGMTCDNCKIRVENAFNSLPDCYAKVSLKNKCAEVWTNTKMNEEEIASVVKKNGYKFLGCEIEK